MSPPRSQSTAIAQHAAASGTRLNAPGTKAERELLPSNPKCTTAQSRTAAPGPCCSTKGAITADGLPSRHPECTAIAQSRTAAPGHCCQASLADAAGDLPPPTSGSTTTTQSRTDGSCCNALGASAADELSSSGLPSTTNTGTTAFTGPCSAPGAHAEGGLPPILSTPNTSFVSILAPPSSATTAAPSDAVAMRLRVVTFHTTTQFYGSHEPRDEPGKGPALRANERWQRHIQRSRLVNRSDERDSDQAQTHPLHPVGSSPPISERTSSPEIFLSPRFNVHGPVHPTDVAGPSDRSPQASSDLRREGCSRDLQSTSPDSRPDQRLGSTNSSGKTGSATSSISRTHYTSNEPSTGAPKLGEPPGGLHGSSDSYSSSRVQHSATSDQRCDFHITPHTGDASGTAGTPSPTSFKRRSSASDCVDFPRYKDLQHDWNVCDSRGSPRRSGATPLESGVIKLGNDESSSPTQATVVRVSHDGSHAHGSTPPSLQRATSGDPEVVVVGAQGPPSTNEVILAPHNGFVASHLPGCRPPHTRGNGKDGSSIGPSSVGDPHPVVATLVDNVTVTSSRLFVPRAWQDFLRNTNTIHIASPLDRSALALRKNTLREKRLLQYTQLSQAVVPVCTNLPTVTTDVWTGLMVPVVTLHSRPIPAMDLNALLHAARLHTFTAVLADEICAIFDELDYQARTSPPGQCPLSPPFSRFIAERLIQDGIATQLPYSDCGSLAPALLNITAEKLDSKPRWRILTDTLWVNAQSPVAHVRHLMDLMVSADVVVNRSAAYSHMSTVDMEKSFFQVPLPPGIQRLFGFMCPTPSGQPLCGVMSRLPMGYKRAVDIMHRIMMIFTYLTILKMVQRGLSVANDAIDVYVDNAAYFSNSTVNTESFISCFNEVCESFHATVGETAVGSTLVHRGIKLDLLARSACLKPASALKLTQRISRAMDSPLSVQMLETLVGQLVYADTVLNPRGAKKIHSLITDLIIRRSHRRSSTMISRPMSLTELALAREWVGSSRPSSFRPNETITSVSDASDEGAALIVVSPTASTLWQYRPPNKELWCKIPIYAREALPLIALRAMFPAADLRCFIDNTTLAGAIHRRYSPSSLLHSIVGLILGTRASTVAHWIPTDANPADLPSRDRPISWPSIMSPPVQRICDGLSRTVNDGSWRRGSSAPGLSEPIKIPDWFPAICDIRKSVT